MTVVDERNFQSFYFEGLYYIETSGTGNDDRNCPFLNNYLNCLPM